MTAFCLLVFLIAVDGGLGSRFLHAPLVSCTLLGLVLGDPATGLYYGSMCEVVSLMMDDEAGMGVFAACLLPAVIKGGGDNSVSVTLLALTSVAAFGFEALMSLFVPMARNAAEKRNIRSLGAANFIPLLIRGVLAVCLGAFAYTHAKGMSSLITNFYSGYTGILTAVDVFAGLLPFLGLSVVLRNLSLQNHYGALFAGFSTALLAGARNSWTLLVCSAIGFGFAFYDFHHREVTKNDRTASSSSTVTKKGSAEKWW